MMITPAQPPPTAPITVRLTLVAPDSGCAGTDVELTVPAGTTLTAVRDALLAAAGIRRPGFADVAPAGSSPAAVHDQGGAALYADGLHVPGSAAVGLPPLLDGCLLTVSKPGVPAGTAAGTATSPLELHAVAGPDAGTRFALPPGRWRLGRSISAQLRLADAELSRVHAEFAVRASGVTVRDLGSTNGTAVAGRRIGSVECPVQPGDHVHLGTSTVAVHAARDQEGGGLAFVYPDARGHLLVNRTPRLSPPEPAPTIVYPQPPAAPPQPVLPWAGVLLPLVMSVPAAVLWHQPVSLLIAALSPVAGLGQFIADLLGRRRRRAGTLEAYADQVRAADDQLAAALQAEIVTRHARQPDLALVTATATGPLQRLWERRPGDADALVVRIGIGRAEAEVQVVRPHAESPTEHVESSTQDVPPGTRTPVPGDPVLVDPVLVENVPLTLDLGSARIVGLAGPREEVLGLARSMLGQLAVWHSPTELRITVIRPRPGPWDWITWLPHTDPDPGSGSGSVHLPGMLPALDRGQVRVVVLDGVHLLRLDPHVAALIGDDHPDGMLFLCLDDDAASLPAECAATVVLADGDATIHARDRPAVHLTADRAGPGWALRVARALAPLRDAAHPGDADAPAEQFRPADLLTSKGFDVMDSGAIARRGAGRSRA